MNIASGPKSIPPSTLLSSDANQAAALATASGTPVVPQGGNTGLVGGQVPDLSGRAIVLSLSRLDRIREIDPLSNTATVEAGTSVARIVRRRSRETSDARASSPSNSRQVRG